MATETVSSASSNDTSAVKYPTIRPLGGNPSPPSDEESIDSKNAKSRRTTHACNHCRSKRAKCDGQLPTCSTCAKRGKTCEYTNVDGRRRKGLTKTIESLEERLNGFEALVTRMKLSSNEDATELLSQLREGKIDPDEYTLDFSTPADPKSSVDSRSIKQSDSPISSPTDSARPSVTIYTARDLPPRDLVTASIDAFYHCSHTLFATFTKEEIDDMLDRIYGSQDSSTVDNATMCELCAVAAIGCHYASDDIPQQVAESLYSTASLNLNDCVEADLLRSLRIFVCLGMCCFMNKRKSARLILNAGLQLARWLRHNITPDSPGWNIWRKTYRTLVFMECWLSATLGYQFDLSDEEIAFTDTEIHEQQPTMENVIQTQMSHVCLRMARILRDVYACQPSLVFSNIENHAVLLNQWQQGLPSYMQLSSLTSPDDYMDGYRKSLLLVHIMYMGSKILLTRRLLVENDTDGAWSVRDTSDRMMHLQNDCLVSAQMCARLLDLLANARSEYRRCWLCIGHAFTASTVLLYDVSRRLTSRGDNMLTENLALAEACIDMLRCCRAADHVARSMFNVIEPLYLDLQRLVPGLPSRKSSNVTSCPTIMSPPGQVDLAMVRQRLTELILNPFGSSYQSGSNSWPTTGETWWDNGMPKSLPAGSMDGIQFTSPFTYQDGLR